MTLAKCDAANLAWKAHKGDNDNIRNINEDLTSFFLQAIKSAYKRHLVHDFVGIMTQSFWVLFSIVH